MPTYLTVALPPPQDRSLADVWSALGGGQTPALAPGLTAPGPSSSPVVMWPGRRCWEEPVLRVVRTDTPAAAAPPAASGKGRKPYPRRPRPASGRPRHRDPLPRSRRTRHVGRAPTRSRVARSGARHARTLTSRWRRTRPCGNLFTRLERDRGTCPRGGCAPSRRWIRTPDDRFRGLYRSDAKVDPGAPPGHVAVTSFFAARSHRPTVPRRPRLSSGTEPPSCAWTG